LFKPDREFQSLQVVDEALGKGRVNGEHVGEKYRQPTALKGEVSDLVGERGGGFL